jgi:lysozyme family protein
MAVFEEAIGGVIADEGGYVNDPKDPGGETKYGISKRSYPNLDIKNLTLQQAKDIYKQDFWLFDGLLSQPVANKIFDMYVNIKHTAIRLAQKVAGAVPDGVYGTKTEAAINAMDPATFLSRYRVFLVQHFIDLSETSTIVAQDLKGLLKRARE